MSNIDSNHGVEQKAGEMIRSACSGRAVLKFRLVGLRKGNELPQIVGRKILACNSSVVADLQSTRGNILDQEIVGLDGRNPTGRKADDNQSPTPGDSADRGVKYICAQHVEHDVGASSVRRCEELRA